MFIEVWTGSENEILNADCIARVVALHESASVEVHMAYVPWDLPDNYHTGDPLMQRLNVVIYDVSYADFKTALLSGKPFVSLGR